MKDTLKPGIESEFTFRVTESKTVPSLYPESAEFQEMPRVFATGFLVGFIEWACIKAVNPHLDWPREQTVGTHIDVSHTAATPAGFTVTARVKLAEVEGRRLLFEVEARDETDLISKGRHERFIINKDKFNSKMKEKIDKKGEGLHHIALKVSNLEAAVKELTDNGIRLLRIRYDQFEDIEALISEFITRAPSPAPESPVYVPNDNDDITAAIENSPHDAQPSLP